MLTYRMQRKRLIHPMSIVLSDEEVEWLFDDLLDALYEYNEGSMNIVSEGSLKIMESILSKLEDRYREIYKREINKNISK